MDSLQITKLALKNLHLPDEYIKGFVSNQITDQNVTSLLLEDKSFVLARVFVLVEAHQQKFIQEFQRLTHLHPTKRSRAVTIVQQESQQQFVTPCVPRMRSIIPRPQQYFVTPRVRRIQSVMPRLQQQQTVRSRQPNSRYNDNSGSGGIKKRVGYTKTELQEVLNFVCKNGKHHQTASLPMWTRAKREGHFPKRTDCALLQMFRRRVLPILDELKLSKFDKDMLMRKKTKGRRPGPPALKILKAKGRRPGRPARVILNEIEIKKEEVTDY